MSFQAYIDNIKAKTGKTPEDFRKLAEEKGLLKPGFKAGDIIAWLKNDFGLGHGHAMAIYAVFTDHKSQDKKPEEAIDKLFSGGKSIWRDVFDHLIHDINKFGNDIKIAPTNTYISLLKGNKKFAIVYFTTDRMDIGIKRKGIEPTKRFELAGTWNTMVTHKVSIHTAKEVDKELMDWFRAAYEAL